MHTPYRIKILRICLVSLGLVFATFATPAMAVAPPTISTVESLTGIENTPLEPIPFTISGAATPATFLVVTGASSNPAVVPDANIVFGGSGANRTVTITPAAYQVGPTNITLTVEEGSLSASTVFALTINPDKGADPNKDGELNLMEYATGQDPYAATSARPDMQLTPTTLEYTYTRSKAALAEGIVFNTEWSDTLAEGSWDTSGVSAPIVLSDNGATETVKVTVPRGVGTSKRFARLRFIKPTPVIKADFARSLGAFNHSPGRALSSTPGRWNFNDLTYNNLKKLGLEYARVSILEKQMFDETRAPIYQNKDSDNGLRVYGWLAKKILINFPFGTMYRNLVNTKGWPETEYMDKMTDALVYFKSKYPKIEFVEIDNEPEGLTTVSKHYFAYSKACTVVKRVNDKIQAGEISGPTLLVGGPTLYKFDETQNVKWLQPFLDAYVADQSTDKRLDFITYHQYLIREIGTQDPSIFKDQPIRAGNVQLINEELVKRNLPLLPIHVTEGGIFAMSQPDPTPVNDFFIKAAGQLALDYYFLDHPNVIPYRWAPDAIEPVKCLFVPNNGVPRPFYHATNFQTLLPPTRYACETDLDAKGMGLGTLAGGTADRVALLAWNYQWTNTLAKDVTLRLENLPLAFQQKNIRLKVTAVRLYKTSGDAAVEDDRIISPAASYEREIHLNPNEFVLLELSTI